MAKGCYIHLVVKGNSRQAVKAAEAHGLNMSNRRKLRNETTGRTATSNASKVARWFSADAGRSAPYPAGSLLYYREVCK